MKALFINGVYGGVLHEIIDSQVMRAGGESFLQPHTTRVIGPLQRSPPSRMSPTRLYLSTSTKLNNICYIADCVAWETKPDLGGSRANEVLDHLRKWQKGEEGLFTGLENPGKLAANLLTIRNLRASDAQPSTSILVKTRDDLPLGERTRSGGTSEVYDQGDFIVTRAEYSDTLTEQIQLATRDSREQRLIRLSSAPVYPARIQIVTIGFRRNPDVIVETLTRAQGVCERCKNQAPFTRRRDNGPYLEVHHTIPLSEHGPDTIDNSVALCPNCHREVHFG